MSKTIELRRHTESDGDFLTSAGVQAAVMLGESLRGPYDLIVSSGAQRSTQTAACLLAGMGRRAAGGVVVDEGFRSPNEARWREIYSQTKKGDIESFIVADYGFVQAEAQRFADALRRVAGHTPDGGRSLVVGHSPMLEAAVWGVTEKMIPALRKGDGVMLVFDDGTFALGR